MKKKTKKRVFARLLAQELEVVQAGVGPTCISTTKDNGTKDTTNLEKDNDGPLPK